ncbi:pantetheine-phosphate adenylyltransferase [Sulfurospirillum arcachonense]|uniref:pantetheine-phosphate adenylyltransferase n=1 Tax=Sulfurospirillum arcachonense TaxID=57666 RepID=UPI00046A1A9D|nr:pantetheine-phosphate adenylyltransferase [Sulfurospirillum arcachonense]
MSKRVTIYPGTFDPITNGHLDIIKRASAIFDKVIVAIAASENKQPMFDLAHRVKMAKEATKDIKKAEVISFEGLLVNCARDNGSKTILRGLRAVSDFEYELQIGYANASLDKEIDTIYLMPSLESAFISSTVVRDILRHDGDVSHLVPKEIKGLLK